MMTILASLAAIPLTVFTGILLVEKLRDEVVVLITILSNSIFAILFYELFT